MCSFPSFEGKLAMQKFFFLYHFAITAKCTCLIFQMHVHIGIGIQDIQETKRWNERRRVETQTAAKFWVLKKNIKVIYMCKWVQYNCHLYWKLQKLDSINKLKMHKKWKKSRILCFLKRQFEKNAKTVLRKKCNKSTTAYNI